jgi:hypothetical protein
MDLPEKWIYQKNGFDKVGYHHEIAIHKTSYDLLSVSECLIATVVIASVSELFIP